MYKYGIKCSVLTYEKQNKKQALTSVVNTCNCTSECHRFHLLTVVWKENIKVSPVELSQTPAPPSSLSRFQPPLLSDRVSFACLQFVCGGACWSQALHPISLLQFRLRDQQTGCVEVT